MKTIFSKKILACVLAVCMLFTMCAGVLSVSAETLEGSATIGTAVYNAEGTVVPVTFTAADIGGADLRINVPTGLTITKVELVAGEVEVSYLKDADSEPVLVTVDDAETADVNEAVSEIDVYTREGVAQFIILDDTAEFVGQDEVEIELTFAGEVTEEVAITFANGTMGGNVDEGQYELTLTSGMITVPHVHTPGEPVRENEVPATCDTDGSYDEVVYCTECDEEISRETIVVAALGHSWDEGVVTTEPDCDDAGVKTYTCSVCGTTTTEAIGALGHTEVEVPAVAPTCVDTGLTAGTKCSVCEAVLVAQEVVPATGEHTYENGECTVCGAADPNAGPVIDEAFDNPLRFIVGISESVGVNVIFTKPAKYDSFKIRVNRNAFDNSYNYTPAAEIVWEASDAYMSSGTQYGFRYRDVPLYAMSERIVFTFEGYEDGVLTGISNPYYWRLDDFVAGYVNNPSTAEGTKKLYSEVLWLGQYSWVNFKNSAASTASIQNLDSPVAKISTEPVADYTVPDATAKVTENGDVTFSRTMVGVTTVPTFKVVMSGMTADIRANATFVAAHNSIVLKGEQRFPYALSANDAIMQQAGAMNAFAHTGIALYDSDKLIEFKVEMNGEVIGRFVTSLAIETYAARQTAISQGKTDTAAMYDRVLILGEVARECFEK